jgi:Raf kinase inhibitor-like YbhB/YbcL family protein
MNTRFLLLFLFVALFLGLVVSVSHSRAAQPSVQAASAWENPFRLTSGTFKNDQMIPASMVFNGSLGSACTGGNQSPELSWTSAGPFVRSYAVALFDESANFAHWGVYNIPAGTHTLAAGAGSPTSTTLQQVYNDAGIQGYTGPCPPPGSETDTNGIHQYVFTVYALDKELNLIPSPDFPPYSNALYRAMIGHVIDTASITGLFNCNDDSSACN